MVAFVLADAYRRKFGGDHIDDVRDCPGGVSSSGSGEEVVSMTSNAGGAIVLIGFMGAGRSTAALRARRRAQPGGQRPRQRDRAARRCEHRRAVRARRRAGRSGELEESSRASCSSGAATVRWSRWAAASVTLRARARSARAATSSSGWTWIPTLAWGRVAGARRRRGRWHATAAASTSATGPALRALRRGSPTPSFQPRRSGELARVHDAAASDCGGARRHAPAVGDQRLRASIRCCSAAALLGAGAVAAGRSLRRDGSASPTSTLRALWLRQLGELAGTIVIAAGEQAKTLASAERVWRELARAG